MFGPKSHNHLYNNKIASRPGVSPGRLPYLDFILYFLVYFNMTSECFSRIMIEEDATDRGM